MNTIERYKEHTNKLNQYIELFKIENDRRFDVLLKSIISQFFKNDIPENEKIWEFYDVQIDPAKENYFPPDWGDALPYLRAEYLEREYNFYFGPTGFIQKRFNQTKPIVFTKKSLKYYLCKLFYRGKIVHCSINDSDKWRSK